MTERRIGLGPLASIPDGECRGFDPLHNGRDSLFAIRRGEQIYAWLNACPHVGYQGAPLAWRKHAYLNADRDKVVCSGHGAQFDIESGVCVKGPCSGQGLQKADVRVSEDGCMYWCLYDAKQ